MCEYNTQVFLNLDFYPGGVIVQTPNRCVIHFNSTVAGSATSRHMTSTTKGKK